MTYPSPLYFTALALATVLLASQAQALTVKLAWDAPPLSSGIPDGYTMYRKIGNGQFELLATVGAITLTYTDNQAVLGQQCYHVTAFNAGGESPPSNEACFQGVQAPGSPQALRIVP